MRSSATENARDTMTSAERVEVLPRHRPLQRETLESQIYRALRIALLEGAYPGGKHLVQEELAAEFGTSRIPVRDALKRLAADGLVAEGEQGSYHVVTFGPEDAEEVCNLRALLEPYAARLALDRMTDAEHEHLRRLTGDLIAAARAGDVETYTQTDTSLHMALYEASGMPRLVRIIEGLWAGRPPLAPLQLAGRVGRSLEDHERMLAALERRDGDELGRILETRILRTLDALLEYYREQG